MIKRYYLFIGAALLAGCASVATRPAATAPTGESVTPAAQAQQAIAPQPGEAITAEPKPVMSANQAVIALLDLAQHDSEAGKREAAGASLERALRIEPRNPWLWHELAQLRLAQGQYDQAISLTRKSNSFAGQERRLQALNWRLIGNARVAQGDSAGAEQAYKQAAGLEQMK